MVSSECWLSARWRVALPSRSTEPTPFTSWTRPGYRTTRKQLVDRTHRASRIHQVTAFYYRSRGSIEEYIKEVTDEKEFTNESVLDIRRNGFRAVKK